jgi:hypothetical protein
MARCPVELLDDLVDVLRAVRGWEGVVEKSPGVLYARRHRSCTFIWWRAGGAARISRVSRAGARLTCRVRFPRRQRRA